MRELYALVAVSIALSALLALSISSVEEPETVHWHASIVIMINGQEVPIPAGVGLHNGKEDPIHTHDWSGTIHMEGTAREFRLGDFFDTWGVAFSRDCLFQYCGRNLEMIVNGERSEEYDSYLLGDADEIMLILDVF